MCRRYSTILPDHFLSTPTPVSLSFLPFSISRRIMVLNLFSFLIQVRLVTTVMITKLVMGISHSLPSKSTAHMCNTKSSTIEAIKVPASIYSNRYDHLPPFLCSSQYLTNLFSADVSMLNDLDGIAIYRMQAEEYISGERRSFFSIAWKAPERVKAIVPRISIT